MRERLCRSARGILWSTYARQSRLYRILAFVLGGRLLLRLGFEYRAITYRIVYVGALAVLFVFVVRLLDVSRWVRTPSETSSSFTFPRLLGVGRGRLWLAYPTHTVPTLSPQLRSYVSRRDDVSLRTAYGQYRYTEAVMYVRVVGLVRVMARRGGVTRSGQSGYVSGEERRKAQLVGEQLSRRGRIYAR